MSAGRREGRKTGRGDGSEVSPGIGEEANNVVLATGAKS